MEGEIHWNHGELLRLTQHVIQRYMERVRPDLDRQGAIAALVTEIEKLDGALIAEVRRSKDFHIHIPGGVLVVDLGKVVTVLKPNVPGVHPHQNKYHCEYCSWSGGQRQLLEHVMRTHLMRQEAAE